MTIAHSPTKATAAAPKAIVPRASAARRYMLSSRSRHRIRVCVLDDHPVIALGMASFLHNQTDFEVTTASSTSRAMSPSSTSTCPRSRGTASIC